jgi:hypothetical protein
MGNILVVDVGGMSFGGPPDMVAELLHCNIYYGIAARAKYRQTG